METIKRICRKCRPHARFAAIGFAALILANATRLILPLFSGWIVDDVIEGGLVEKLPGLCAGILGLTVLRAVCNYIRGVSFEKLSQNYVYDLRTSLYRHLSEMSYSFYDKNYIGEIMSRMTGDIEGIRNLLAGGVVQICENAIWFFGSLILLFFINWRLALVMVLIAPIVAVIALKFHSKIHVAFKDVREQNAVLSTKTQENISGVRVVKAFAQEEHEKQAFSVENRKQLRLLLRTTFIWSDYVPLLDFLGAFCTPLLLGIGGAMVIGGSMSLGDLVAFTGYIWMITDPMRILGNLINMLTQAITSAEKLFYYEDLGAEIRDKEHTEFPKPFRGHVRFDHVTFGYGDETVLRDLCLDVPAGTTCAIMGATGTGKTSIVNLLGRYYECREGRVMIDGIDVKDMPLKSLRDRIGYVMQETFLFSETIENNIRFGRPNAEFPVVESAAAAAQAAEFIAEMPQGYDTVVGERGLGLSGGQKQRVAIARALAYDPTILVLDDSTSAVDMETEHKIQMHLKKELRDRTTFIIAHRISSVKNADQIIVLKDGSVFESGTHDELLAKKGLYYEMYQDQYRDFESITARQRQQTAARSAAAAAAPQEVV